LVLFWASKKEHILDDEVINKCLYAAYVELAFSSHER
jgi:hypothetical protein